MLEYMHGIVSYHKINNVLFAAIIIVNAYIIVAPLWPQISFWWQANHTNRRAQLTQALNTSPVQHKNANPAHTKPNTLIIPAMFLDQPVLEGPEKNWFNLLKQGIWHWPASSTPDKGGNTVFLAHRFSYTGPRGAFYYLNKLKPGNIIGVIWNNKTYHYAVVSSTTVPPTDTAVENNTADAQLTLFTCTPLWHPVDRLVVVAKLETSS